MTISSIAGFDPAQYAQNIRRPQAPPPPQDGDGTQAGGAIEAVASTLNMSTSEITRRCAPARA